jgi:hypothetical protein
MTDYPEDYVPTTWEDEIPGEDPITYDIAGLTAGKTIVPHVAVTPGTPVDATNLNNIEQGIADAQIMAQMPVQHRQGGSATEWATPGIGNKAVSVKSIIQVGAFPCITSGGATFPIPFTHAPLVFVQVYGSIAPLSIPVITGCGSTGFTVDVSTDSEGRFNSVFWMAIGPIE